MHMRFSFFFLLALIAARCAQGEISSTSVRMSLDISGPIGGTNYTDEQAISLGATTSGTFLDTGIDGAARVQLDALLVRSNLIIFSTDVDFTQGATTYADEDLVAYNAYNGAIAMYFDGSVRGVPVNADLDAACFYPGTTNLLLSFDIDTTLAGAGIVSDEDVILFAGGTFSKLYTGTSQLGIPRGADLDALDHDGTNLYFSLDISAQISSLDGSDKDIWRMNTNTFVATKIGVPGIAAGADLTSLDDPRDADGDWLTDFEEQTAIDEAGTTIPGSTTPLTPTPNFTLASNRDTDGDGVPDGEEAAAGTNPTNLVDYLRITAIAPDTIGSLVTWASVPGKVYDIQASTGLSPFAVTNVVADDVNATGGSTAITNASVVDALFYRVRLQP